MNETSFTYQGVTVNYSEAQKAIILADQNLITQLKNQLIAHQNEIARLEGVINSAKNQLDNVCNGLSKIGSPSPKQACIDANNQAWDRARADQTTVYGYITANGVQQTSAVKKLNDDIATIQNDIKLQIQTQLANTAAATAAAGNQATVTTAPTVAMGNAAAQIEQLKNENEQAKLKQEQNVKIALFGFVAVVVIVIAVLVIRRVS